MQLFRQAVERDPGNAEALLYLAGALASSGRPADALPYFQRALDAGPPSTMALNGLGLTRLALGDTAGRGGRVPAVAAPRSPPARDCPHACHGGTATLMADCRMQTED